MMVGSTAGVVESIWSFLFGYNITLHQLLWIFGFDWAFVTLIFVGAGLAAPLAGIRTWAGVLGAGLGIYLFWAGSMLLVFNFHIHRHLTNPRALLWILVPTSCALLLGRLVCNLAGRVAGRALGLSVLGVVWLAETVIAFTGCMNTRISAFVDPISSKLWLTILLTIPVTLTGLRYLAVRPRTGGGRADIPAPAGLRFSLLHILALALVLTPIGWWTHSQTRPIKVPLTVQAPAGEPRPNLLLIVLDTVRSDRLTIYGARRNTSPNLQAFAEECVVFDRAITPSSYSLPSHATLLTGLYPAAHQCEMRLIGDTVEEARKVPMTLAAENQTLAEWLAGEGYLCGAVSANSFFITRKFGFEQGFHYFSDRHGNRLWFYPRMAFVGYKILSRFIGGIWDMDEYRDAGNIVDECEDWMSGIPDDRPYFLFINFMDAHYPYTPPNSHRGIFSYAADSDWASLESEGYDKTRLSFYQNCRDRYDEEIAYLDSQFGRFLESLRRRPDWERTVVLITSDHGESQGERGKEGHGWSLFSSELWVPMILRLPGGPRGARDSRLVELTDVAPTILDLCGIEAGQELPGSSLLAEPGEELAICKASGAGAPDKNGLPTNLWALYRDGTKLLINTEKGDWLFDYSESMVDGENILAAHADLAAERAAELQRWIEENDDAGKAGDAMLDDNVLDLLKAVGYLE
jgi:arylsulfatase A-like enzyme